MTTRGQILRSSITGNTPTAGTRAPGEVWTNFPDLQLGVIDAGRNAQKLVAVRYFSTSANYAIGDFAVQAGALYVANSAVTAGAFNASNWNKVVVVGDLSALPYLPIAGGTLTGNTVISTAAWPSFGLKSAAAGSARQFLGYTGNNLRWEMDLGDGSAESGSNAGSNFSITRYNDAGTVIDAPFSISRATGAATFGASAGEVDITPASGYASLQLAKGASGQGNQVVGYTGGLGSTKIRWNMQIGDNAAESGSNAGSNFAITRYSDAGAFIDQPFVISRANGAATFSNSLIAPYLAVKTISASDALIDLAKSGSGRNNLISGYTGSTSATALRWQMALGDSTAETGASVGSNFGIARYGDTGTYIDTPLLINRASGTVSFNGSLTANGSVVSITSFVCKNGTQPNYTFQDAGGTLKGQTYWASSSSKMGLWVAAGTEAVINNVNQFQTTTFYNLTATAYMAGGTTWTNTSDARIKNVVGDYEPGLDEVLQLRPIRYTFKGNDTWVNDLAAHPLGEDGVELEPVLSKTGAAPYPGSTHYDYAVEQKEFVGFVAQEVESILPGAVTKRRGFIDGQEVSDMRDLNLHELLFALVNSVKTLAARVQELEAAGA